MAGPCVTKESFNASPRLPRVLGLQLGSGARGQAHSFPITSLQLITPPCVCLLFIFMAKNRLQTGPTSHLLFLVCVGNSAVHTCLELEVHGFIGVQKHHHAGRFCQGSSGGLLGLRGRLLVRGQFVRQSVLQFSAVFRRLAHTHLFQAIWKSK